MKAFEALGTAARGASLWLGLLGAVACAQATPPATPTAVTPKLDLPAAKTKPAKERLLDALRAVPRSEPVVELLPKEAQTALDTRLKSLTPEQREQVSQGELARTVPLLHLTAGGTSPAALLTLATTPVSARELPQAFEAAPTASDAERLAVVRLVHDVAKRAGEQFLRASVLDVANAQTTELLALLAAVERAARAAERPDIVRLALESAIALEPSSALSARLAVACAFEQDDACFAEAEAGVPTSAPEHARVARLQAALLAQSATDPVAKAWALLELGRYADARAALGSVQNRARTSLRVGAALAVAASEGSACPGLPPQVGSPRSCVDAAAVKSGLASALGDLDLAWQSGADRDAVSAEAYIGLAHVVPWVASLSRASDAAGLEREFGQRYHALADALRQLPEQKPFGVFASALAAGVSVGLHTVRGERPQLDSGVKQELWFGALGVDAPAPRLAVASVLAADQAVAQLIPGSPPASLGAARAGLLAWEAVSAGEQAPLEAARAALAEQVQRVPKGSAEAATSVLLLAELEAAATPSERTYRSLAQVSSQLVAEALPPDLALRAVLDAAGALERLGRASDALVVLTKAAEIAALPGPAGDLQVLIRAEKLVLEWDAKKDPSRGALAKALAALPASASPSIAFAVATWGGSKVARQGNLTARQRLEQRIGVRAAELMLKGGLRGTRVSLRVSYDFHEGILPEVTFEPMFVPLVRGELLQKAL
jgi:hypothetical protein